MLAGLLAVVGLTAAALAGLSWTGQGWPNLSPGANAARAAALAPEGFLGVIPESPPPAALSAPDRRHLLGPGPALMATNPAAVGLPIPVPVPQATLTVYNAVLAPQPSDALFSLALERAQERADAVVAGALGSGQPWQLTTPLAELRGALTQPVSGRLAIAYGPTSVPGLTTTRRHPGLTYEVAAGAPVQAVARGIVVGARELNGYGAVVIIDHGTGYHSVYAYLSRVDVNVGASVEAQQVVGATGPASPHEGRRVYFELRHLGDALDPTPWLRPAH